MSSPNFVQPSSSNYLEVHSVFRFGGDLVQGFSPFQGRSPMWSLSQQVRPQSLEFFGREKDSFQIMRKDSAWLS